MLADKKTPQRSQERQRKKDFSFLSCLPDFLLPLLFSDGDLNLLLGSKFTKLFGFHLFEDHNHTLLILLLLFVALCCCSSLPPAAVSQPGQKPHFQPSTNQICLRRAVLPKSVLVLYCYFKAVSSWDSLSVSVISTFSDYLSNKAKQVSLIFSLHFHDFLFSNVCLGLSGIPLFLAENWLCSTF